jgi:hypothetical protein
MTKQQEHLQRACDELGLRVVIPFTLALSQGRRVEAQALIPQLGSPKGMIVFSRCDELDGREEELVSMGYGYSVYGGLGPEDEYDVANYREMFVDLGWGAKDERAPDWMRQSG